MSTKKVYDYHLFFLCRSYIEMKVPHLKKWIQTNTYKIYTI